MIAYPIMQFLKKKKKEKEKYLILNYEISAGIPFKWEVEIEDPSIVELEKKEVLKSKSKKPLCGGPVYTDYYFKGLKKGETNILFKFVSITGERDDELIETHHVVVDEELNIKKIINKEDDEII